MSQPRMSAVILALWMGLAEVSGCQSLHAGTAIVVEGLEPGQRPPDFLLQDLAGHSHSLSQYRGHVVVLHFWATWCPFCRGEIPKLTEAHQHWSSDGVTIVAVSVDQHREHLVDFVTTAGVPYAVVADIDLPESVARRYHVSGLPTTFIIGRDGRIVARLLGSSDIHGELERALAAPTPSS